MEQELKDLGLVERETRIYLYLLENGHSSPPQIAKGTGIARTNTYHILKSLEDKKLVEEQTQGKRKIYIATDPNAIVESLERKKTVATKLLPDLRALYKAERNKPVIKFLEGRDQVIAGSLMQSLESEEVLFIGSTSMTKQSWPDFFVKYEKLLMERGVILKDLMPYESAMETGQSSKERMGDTLYSAFALPKIYKDVPTNILIWGNNVALISLEEPIFGTVLSNKHFADTFRILFDIASKSSTKI